MAAQVLWNLADSPAVPGTAGFTDVPSDAWYAGAVNWSASRGIVTGYSTGAFGPEDAVTREQLAAMLYRYAGTPEPTGSLDGFNDKDAVSDYAADALCWAVDEGLLTGKAAVGSIPPAPPPVPRWPPFSCALQNPTTKHRSPPDQGLILLGTQCDLWTTQPVRVNKKDSKS